MRTLILIIFTIILFPKLSFTQSNELRNKILWDENRPLVWKDFKGPANNKSSYNAETTSGISIKAEQLSQNEIRVNIATYFDPKKSWKQKKSISDNLLRHEQNHFDISEVYSRLLIKKLSGLEMNSLKTISNIIKKEYLQTNKEVKNISQEYDKETNHGKNKEQQEIWNNKVENLLSETKDFDLDSFTIILIPTKSTK